MATANPSRLATMAKRKWVIVSSELVIEPYYVRVHDGFSVVFALTADLRVVMTRQYKHGIGDVVLELPAGALEPGEAPAACAARELEEETGFVAPDLELLAEFAADPTSSTGRLFLYLACEAAAVGNTAPDVTEDIETVLLTVPEVLAKVRSGEIYGQSHVAAIYTALDRLGLVVETNPG